MEKQEIIHLNAELAKLILESVQPISDSLSKTKFKKTGRALISYIPRAGYVNNAILSCYDSNNSYSAGILFRSMVEHAFRHQYLFVRALKEDSDLVGEEYYSKLKGSEDLESITKINNYTKVVHPDRTVWSTKGEHNKNIADVGKQFGLSKIFYYLMENFDHEDKVISNGMKDYFLERLNQYTMLSSYVHGGPYAEMCHEELIKDKEKMQTHLESITSESLGLYKSIVETTHLFAYMFDDKLLLHWEAVRDLGKKNK